MNRELLVILVVGMLGLKSHAEVFQFFLDGYPKEERSCHNQSNSIGNYFEETVKVKVLHVECVKERKTGSDFVIEYEAPQKLEVASTQYRGLSIAQPGRYREKAECLKNLSRQKEIFEKATSLNPVFTYCSSQELEVGKNWEVIITAIGHSDIQPMLDSYLMFMQPQGVSQEEIAEGLKQTIEKRGGVFADLIFHFNSVMGTGEGSVHYFAPKRIDFNLERLSQVPSLEICFKQSQEVKHFLSSEKDSLFTIYCGGPSFGFYDLHIGIVDKPSFTWQNSADTFTSFNECEAQREIVLSHYAGSPTKPLLGGYCSRNYQTDKYQVIVYKRK